MQLIEITWNSDASAQLISQLRSELPTCKRLGLEHQPDHLEQAIAAGAQFCSPHINSAMIQAAAQRSVPIKPGRSPQKLSPLGKQELALCFQCKQWRAATLKVCRATESYPIDSNWRRHTGKCTGIFCCLGRSQSYFRSIISSTASSN